jgi:hypothetical protein
MSTLHILSGRQSKTTGISKTFNSAASAQNQVPYNSHIKYIHPQNGKSINLPSKIIFKNDREQESGENSGHAVQPLEERMKAKMRCLRTIDEEACAMRALMKLDMALVRRTFELQHVLHILANQPVAICQERVCNCKKISMKFIKVIYRFFSWNM